MSDRETMSDRDRAAIACAVLASIALYALGIWMQIEFIRWVVR